MVGLAWEKPLEGHLKINVKAFSAGIGGFPFLGNGNNHVIGGVIRDSRGNFLKGFVGVLLEENHVVVALRTCFAGVRLAIDHISKVDARNGGIRLQLETGDEVALEAIDAPEVFGIQEIVALSDRFVELMKEANDCVYRVVNPPANSAAMFMAKYALNNLDPGNLFTFQDPIDELVDILKVDNNRDMVFLPSHGVLIGERVKGDGNQGDFEVFRQDEQTQDNDK